MLVLAATILGTGNQSLLGSVSARNAASSVSRATRSAAIAALQTAGVRFVIDSETADALDDETALYEILTISAFSRNFSAKSPHFAPPAYGALGEWGSAPTAHDAARAGLRAPAAAVVVASWAPQAQPSVSSSLTSTSAAAALLSSRGGALGGPAAPTIAVVGFEWADGPAWVVLDVLGGGGEIGRAHV